MLGLFKKKVPMDDAMRALKEFMVANSDEVLDFVLQRGDPFVLRPDIFGLRRSGNHFDRNWTYAGFALAARFDKPQTRAVCEWALGHTGDLLTYQPIKEFAQSHDIADPDEAYQFLRVIFDASLNNEDFDHGRPVIDASKLVMEGKVFGELLTCARYVIFVCTQFRVVGP